MIDVSSLLEFVPKPVQLMILGGLAFAGMEVRYMTVSDYTKSHILELKQAIRAYKSDLKEAETDRERELIRDQLEILLDELCLDLPNDPYCKDRRVGA